MEQAKTLKEYTRMPKPTNFMWINGIDSNRSAWHQRSARRGDGWIEDEMYSFVCLGNMSVDGVIQKCSLGTYVTGVMPGR